MQKGVIISTATNMANSRLSDVKKKYLRYLKQLKALSNVELTETYNREGRISGWTSSRGYFITALREELKNRGIKIKSEVKP